MHDGELGQFLRSRREAVRPAEVGLPTGSRRRTPGLRRAEVATLAGISVDYLIRLEQGRDRKPSAQVLAALADALRLSTEDRDHLRVLAAIALGPELCPESGLPAQSVRPNVEAVLDRLEPTPAFVLNRVAELLAWTSGYDALVRPLGILDADRPNLVAFTFADPRARAVFPDWDEVADDQAGTIRAACGPHDTAANTLVEWLTTASGPAFLDRWQAAPVLPKRTGVQRIAHPEVGTLRIAYETLQLPDAEDQRLVVYLPADDATAVALDRLTGRRPGALRAVNS